MWRSRKKHASKLPRWWPFRKDPPPPRRGRAVLLVLLALVAFRVSLPYAVEAYVDRKLDESPDYDGNVGDVDINWLMDGYRIKNVEIVSESKSPLTLFRVAEVDLGIHWEAILHGALVAAVRVVRPEANLEIVPPPKKVTKVDYPALLRKLYPFRIDRLEIVNGTVRLAKPIEGPDIDVSVRNVDVLATNLTNSLKASESLFGHVSMTGRPLGDSSLKVNMLVDPTAEAPTFKLDLQLRGLPLKRLNPWLDYLADFDVEKGSMDVYAEVAAKGGRFDGYLKPMFHDLQVFSIKHDLENKKKSVFRKAWEAIVGVAAELVENQPKEQIAARIPFEGRLDHPEIGVWQAVGSALSNAFVRALHGGLERSVTFRSVPPPQMHKKEAEKAKDEKKKEYQKAEKKKKDEKKKDEKKKK